MAYTKGILLPLDQSTSTTGELSKSDKAIAKPGATGNTDTVSTAEKIEPYKPSGGPVVPGVGWEGGGPRDASWQARLVSADEPGERLVLSGTVYRRDGRTPAAGITIFACQADINGLYGSDDPPHTPARISGWVTTGADGRYEFHTIRPGHYPDRSRPAHIHMTISVPGFPEWWLPALHFEGDPLVSEEEYRQAKVEGRWGRLQPLVRQGEVWYCTRDIRL